ncbi:methyltransferase domain-containing protein [Patescibacteria group bacterium]|nr:methyltransferase domain-containing protein [Patescibacteria group bacterium]
MIVKSIIEKFGKSYSVDDDTYHMGIHHLLGDAIARRFIGRKTCLDACAGAGMMAIHLAKYVGKVIAIDINPAHLEQARRNVATASVSNKVELISGDVMEILRSLGTIDSAFLDPDWAKEGDDKENHVLDLSDMVPPADRLLEKIFRKTENVCLRLPKSFDIGLLDDLPKHETETVYLDGHKKFHCVYFGDLVTNAEMSELDISS